MHLFVILIANAIIALAAIEIVRSLLQIWRNEKPAD